MNQVHQQNPYSAKVISVAIIIVILAFYGGMKYGGSTAVSSPDAAFSARTGGVGGAGARRNFTNGGFASGAVLSRDATGVTLKMADGSTKIVFIATSTQVMKATSGTADDLVVGTNVTVTGTANADGSIAAKSVQIRPAGMPDRRTSGN